MGHPDAASHAGEHPHEPVLAVYAIEGLVFQDTGTGILKEKSGVSLEIVNTGSTPVLNMMISGVLCRDKPLSPDLWRDNITILPHQYLAPHSQVPLAIIDKDSYEELFSKEKCIIEITYFDKNRERVALNVMFDGLTSIILHDKGLSFYSPLWP